ncbi:MAG: flavodoxin family protein [Anaerolineae bacterium]|nr:flavodoxin family protein [Anaerolineae bacterium]
MKVIALLGSPRKEGNTDILAGEVLRGAQDAGAEIEKVYLDDLWIRPIGEVGDNSREREDPRDDDDFPNLLERFLNSDVVILASPVYWQGASAQMKCFIDRLSSYFKRPPYAEKFDGKKYIVVCTFGREEVGYHEWITRPMKLTVELLRGEYFGDLCVPVYQKGHVREMPDVLTAAYEMGRAVVTKLAGK